MLTRVPDYYEAFHCLAGACPHTCCEKVGGGGGGGRHARRYQETPRLPGGSGCGRRSRRTRRGISASPSGAAGAPF